ncbi:Cro/Cl family transcriptional regulator [Escherichia coli]|uniref:fimbrial biogenesis chaperone n=2 Tax=Escherichia coli TaxID=562 RepID=UPI000943F829|nr:molecular chaperone [Escherichia coli]EHW7391862.1 molecular chaperone [Escherichia coli]EHX1539152.1 molecular chaperone [Escherichia coli]EHX8496374.1 molecular chaperone [Escherichia coli]EHY2976053.1 molecular chaperone [Escherichia coli]EIP2386779.1 molecular chaperone [Escherichia coli]
MLRIAIKSLFLLSLVSSTAIAGSFGPRENRLIFEGDKTYVQYRIDNTDKDTPWLVQAWVEDSDEKKIKEFMPTPIVFRVEPTSVFSVRVMKTGIPDEQKESFYWVVSNSLPGGEKKEKQKQDNKITASINLAYRFKVPMIYRPASLKNIPQQPERLEWSINDKGSIKVKNPSRYVVQLHSLTINGSEYKGNGVSNFILPMKDVSLSVNAKLGSKIKYGVINDYGAVKEYEGIIKSVF